MGFEDIVDVISDVTGDVMENIQDAVVEVGELSKEAVECLGDKGMEALEKGDLRGAIEYSDIPKEDKESVTKMLEGIELDKLVIGGAMFAGGAIGTVAALATPGFQPAGVAAFTMMMKGAEELTAQYKNKNESTAANA